MHIISDIVSIAIDQHAVIALHYLPCSARVVVMTADYNVLSFALTTPSGEMEVGLCLDKHLVGCNDDILDISVLGNDVIGESDDVTSSDVSSDDFRLAVVTNSPQIRIFDNNFDCKTLNGHTDIVLAIDSSPDGYVFFLHTFITFQLCNIRSRMY